MRAMLDVALHCSVELVARSEIAGRQELSADYVAHLFRRLRDAGLVLGVRGPSGGYSLARTAESICIGEFVRAVEGPSAAADCVLSVQEHPCPRIAQCAAHQVWMRLSGIMAEFLDSTTLADLCGDARNLALEDSTLRL